MAITAGILALITALTEAAAATAPAAAGTAATTGAAAAGAAAAGAGAAGTAAAIGTAVGTPTIVGAAANPVLTTAIAAAPAEVLAPTAAAITPGVAAPLAGPPSTLQTLPLEEATSAFKAGDAGVNLDTIINSVQNVQPSFLDKLGAFGKRAGQTALVGAGTNAAITAVLPGPERGKRAAIGAAAGAVGGGIRGGATAVGDPSLGVQQAIASLGSQPTALERFGGFSQNLLFGDAPGDQILGRLPRDAQPGVLPDIASKFTFGLPFGSPRKATIRRRPQRRRNQNNGFASLLFRR